MHLINFVAHSLSPSLFHHFKCFSVSLDSVFVYVRAVHLFFTAIIYILCTVQTSLLATGINYYALSSEYKCKSWHIAHLCACSSFFRGERVNERTKSAQTFNQKPDQSWMGHFVTQFYIWSIKSNRTEPHPLYQIICQMNKVSLNTQKRYGERGFW